MSGDPAIASIEQLVHAGRLRKRSKGPGPPDVAGEKNHGIRTTDTAAVSSQNANLFQRRAGLEIEPVLNPACLKREEKETAATKYSMESLGGGGARWAIAVI